MEISLNDTQNILTPDASETTTGKNLLFVFASNKMQLKVFPKKKKIAEAQRYVNNGIYAENLDTKCFTLH